MDSEIVLLGLVAAARQLDLSVNRLRYLADISELPSLKDSAGRRLFLPSDVAAYKKQRQQAKNVGKVKLRLRKEMK